MSDSAYSSKRTEEGTNIAYQMEQDSVAAHLSPEGTKAEFNSTYSEGETVRLPHIQNGSELTVEVKRSAFFYGRRILFLGVDRATDDLLEVELSRASNDQLAWVAKAPGNTWS